MKKGDKYIIEIAEVHTHYDDRGIPYSVGRVKGFNSLFLDNYATSKLKRVDDIKLKLSKLKKRVKKLEHDLYGDEPVIPDYTTEYLNESEVLDEDIFSEQTANILGEHRE